MQQGLQLKLGSQLTMTPQLQQAIRLLQLSTLDLQQEVIEQLYNNPLLETDEEHHSSASSENQDEQQSNQTSEDIDLNTDDPLTQDLARDASEPTVTETDETMSVENFEPTAADNNWDSYSSSSSSSSGREVNLEDVYQVTESLQDHLLWQLNLTPFSARDKQIAISFIDAVNESGFLTEDLHEATSHLNAEYQDDQIETDELIAVLKRLQQFDPPGIFARDLQECLLIQLDQLDPETPYLTEAKKPCRRLS